MVYLTARKEGRAPRPDRKRKCEEAFERDLAARGYALINEVSAGLREGQGDTLAPFWGLLTQRDGGKDRGGGGCRGKFVNSDPPGKGGAP